MITESRMGLDARVVALILLVLVSVMLGGRCAPSQAPVPEPAVHASPPGPPCVHEVCEERPAYLLGEDCGTYLCRRYRVSYEHHCTCDRWASPSTTGTVETR